MQKNIEQAQTKNLEVGVNELREYLEIVLKRKHIVLLCFLIPVMITTVIYTVKKPIYRAVARIEMKSGFNIPLKNLYEEEHYNYFNTQIEMIKSVSLQKRIAKRLTPWIGKIPSKYLSADIKIKRVPGTNMLELWVNTPYKEYAKPYADIITDEFLNLKIEQRGISSEFALVSLTKEINKLNDKLNKAQNKLQIFRKENEGVMLEEYGDYSPRHLQSLTSQISKLNTDKVLIGKQIEALEESSDPSFWISVIDNIQQGVVMPAIHKEPQTRPEDNSSSNKKSDEDKKNMNFVEPLPFVFVLDKGQSEKWQALKKNYNSLKSELAAVVNVYKPKHPDRIILERDLGVLTNDMKAEVASLTETYKAKHKGIVLQEEALKSSMNMWKESTLDSFSKVSELETFKNEVERLQKLYDVLIKRVTEIEISSEFGMESVYIVEKPRLLSKPVGPQRIRSIMIVAIMSLGFACGIAFFLDYIDDSVKSSDDLKKYTGLSTLGVVHAVNWNQVDLPSHTVINPLSDNALEAYRSIRTNMLLSAPQNSLRTTLITSALPSEGKTTVSVNTGIVLAQGGLKILLIDGDLRRPTVHKMFGNDNKKGLSSILVQHNKLEECVRKTDVEGLDFLSAGPAIADPPKLLLHSHIKELLEYATTRYDRVLIDSAPLLTVTDSVILSDWVDGIVFVTRGQKTSRMAIIKARDTLLNNSSKILGVIINNLPVKKSAPYYYGYKYKYGYGYGYGRKRAEEKSTEKKEEVII
ncbi:MAG: polysaccharide biosynthesis tyrosine autokinase [Candidatus Omnitrophica bacterium]|nr:polysaccharide biosynthesis tyrosine autokinase [Candidatus Omnitrophota bacterium]